jgi:uncharacterized protein (DUF1697 family)
MKTLVALLRGINVGGKNRVPMSELKSELTALGLDDVVTYVQSGNVVFRAPARSREIIATNIEKRITKAYGLSVAVVVRTPAELARIAKANPFLDREADLSKLHVVFLDGRPTAGAVAKLDPERSPPDEFRVHGREIYLHLPNGSARTKLTLDYFERRLGVTATARNWKTLLKLIELADNHAPSA